MVGVPSSPRVPSCD